MFSLLSSLKSYFTGETSQEAEAEATEPTFKTEVEVKVLEKTKTKTPIYTFGQKAPYYVKNFENVSYIDSEKGETVRAKLLHSWMGEEGFIDKMSAMHLEVPITNHISDPVFIYISADTGAVQATIITEVLEGENYWEEGETRFNTIIEQINTGEEDAIENAIYMVWQKIVAHHDYRHNIQSILLYGYELYNLAELHGCPVVHPNYCFDYIWNYDDDTLFYCRDYYEKIGFTKEVYCLENPEMKLKRSSFPTFALISDFQDYDSSLIQKILPIDPYEASPINIDETIIYIDDYSVSLVELKTCIALESHPITEDIEEIIKNSLIEETI